ncbi:hypothetical protein TNCV_1088171 [Trichonephila clavipes]|uniref:RNA-directed DNA polymerase n=1 Tax=Trichonephila clavipes TaxID=2585209 RepID=A0A8X6SRP5_TRICX|nr:hypothetical protein TNCV_1088171 [Trichonephila clavipes]
MSSLCRDASKTAISCILKQQKPNGNQHPIAFHSRRLRNYEINYTITELECLAIIDSLDKFHCYLHGSHFTVHTDHNALVWLKNFKNPTGRLFRWSLKVSMYDFDIKYKKGSTNVEADILTRNPIAYHIINTPPEPLLDINEIGHFQNIENTSAPKCFKRDGVFVVKRQGLNKIIVPKALRVKLMETTRKKFGHPGVATMLKLISPQYYWINSITDIRNYVKHCETCHINKKSHQRKYGLMQSLPLCEKPFELLSIDSVGGLNYYNSVKKYLHIIIDHATRRLRKDSKYCRTHKSRYQVPIAELAERWTELPQVSDESRSFFRVHTGYFSNIPKCIKAEFIVSWACSQSSVVSSSQR